ncbi:MAG: phosphatase PAP2 family protein [Mycobacterium sp.]
MTFSLRNLRPETTVARSAAILAAALFVVFAALAGIAHHYGSGTNVDHRTLGWLVIHRRSWLTSAAADVTHIGSPAMVSVATVIATLAIWRFTHSLRTAATVAAAVASAFLLAAASKWAVGEHRPPHSTQLVAETGWSFPSGHVTGTTALVGMLTVVAAYRHRGWRRPAVLLAAVVAVMLVAGSRLYLGDHWVVDVLAAVVLSTSVVTIAAATLHETPMTTRSSDPAA